MTEEQDKDCMLQIIKARGDCTAHGYPCKMCPIEDFYHEVCHGIEEQYKKALNAYTKTYGKDLELLEVLV